MRRYGLNTREYGRIHARARLLARRLVEGPNTYVFGVYSESSQSVFVHAYLKLCIHCVSITYSTAPSVNTCEGDLSAKRPLNSHTGRQRRTNEDRTKWSTIQWYFFHFDRRMRAPLRRSWHRSPSGKKTARTAAGLGVESFRLPRDRQSGVCPRDGSVPSRQHRWATTSRHHALEHGNRCRHRQPAPRERAQAGWGLLAYRTPPYQQLARIAD